ncbi:hypothetical protein MN116_003181 [Schistosoma mekongi]|uniref:Uncharacterized protein n=1 Tax=Schistosoma mekongi TaxID=38744 RepID=A0AAE1ZI53_SCHME|nr:hypothetical protein MN116_003181 [Schistosoma mekongi]
MRKLESRVPRRRANSAEPRTNYFVQKISKLVSNESNTHDTLCPKESSINHKPLIQQPKFFNPFSRLAFRNKRKKIAKVKVPPLDFYQSYNELILELAYTSNLTRQLIRPFNRCHLVSQLTECARLIRGRIASGAACIQLPLLSDSMKNDQRVADNRIIMAKINQFNEAHALFIDWINKLSSAPFVYNTFGPIVTQPSEENDLTCQQIILSQSNYSVHDTNLLQDLQCDGELLFCQLQSCALAVFELLKNVGYTTFVEPSCMEASLYESCNLQNEPNPVILKKNDREIESYGTEVPNYSQCNSHYHTSSKSSPSVFTEEDRELLAKLWSYLDPTNNVLGSSSPPPKPPLPNLCPLNIPFNDRRTDSVNTCNQSSPHLSMNPFDDPDLLTYLRTISSTAQLKYPSNSSPSKRSSDFREEFSFPTTTRLDLNAADHLSFPLADESDPSDLESNFNYHSNSSKFKGPCLGQTPIYKPNNSASFSIKDASRSVIEKLKLPARQKPKVDQIDKTSLSSNQTTGSEKLPHLYYSRRLPSHLKDCKYWSKSESSTDSNNPLSDSLMQEQVAKMVMHLQDSDSCTQKLENPLITSTSNVNNSTTTSPSDATSSTTATTVIPNENNNSVLSSDANCESITDYDDYLPNCHSEVKSDTEDAYELIEANGKKYRRHFQRRVVIERHKVREVILAPSLPDGTGPDLNRVVISRPDQSSPRSVNNHDHKHDDELIPSVETLSLDTSGDTSTSDISASHYPAFKPQFRKWNFSRDIADKHNDCLDHIDSEEFKLATMDAEPSKPPLPSEKPLVSYMFRFGSSNCDNPDDERRLSNRLIDFFRDQWLKEEFSEGPHERKKTISYIQSYSQPTTNGDFIHKSTCIQHTCTVRMVGGLQGLKAQANRNAGMKLLDILSDEISDKVSCNSLASSSNEIKTEEVDVSEQLESSDFSSSSRRDSQIITTGEETDDEELHETHLPTQEREIYINIPVAETNVLPILSLLKANEYLVWGDRNDVNDISVHAGCIDALIVYMTSYGRMVPSYYLFFETFLFMYRSFMTSDELVKRLITRYQYFSHPPRYLSHLINLTQEIRSKVCSSTVSILVTVVTRLKRDLNDGLLRILQNFEETLSQDGYSSLSRILHITLCRQSQVYSNSSMEPVNNIHKSNTCISSGGGRASSLGDISPEQSLLSKSYETNQYIEYNDQVGFVTLPKTKSKRSQVLENVDRYSLVESSENDHVNAPIINSLSSKKLLLNTSKSNNPGLLNFSAKSLAEQLTYLDCLNYYKVDITELLDISKLERGKAPGVAACAHHFTIISNWATYQILCLTSASDREKVASRLLDAMEHLYKLQNFSSYLSLLCAFLLVPEALFSRKTRSRLSRITPYMQPPYFSKYRRDLEAANPPLIPYLGLMLQNLVVLAQGNPLFLKTPPTQLADKYQSCHGPIINFWRCWKHFLIIHFFVKQEKMVPEKSRYSIRPDAEILQFFGNFENSLPEAELRRLANRLRRSLS